MLTVMLLAAMEKALLMMAVIFLALLVMTLAGK